MKAEAAATSLGDYQYIYVSKEKIAASIDLLKIISLHVDLHRINHLIYK